MPRRLTIRQTRGIVLGLLLFMLLVTVGAYMVRRQSQAARVASLPARVPGNVRQSEGFSLSKTEEGRAIFTVKAARVREQQDNGKSLLEDVEIITYGTQGNRHDRIFSKLCEYDAGARVVRSRGAVEIELASIPRASVDSQGRPQVEAPADAARPAIFVKTSGVTFEEQTGIVSTVAAVEFRFAEGSGRATGAIYNSNLRTLHLKSAVEMEIAAGTPAAEPERKNKVAAGEPLFIKAAQLLYEQRTGLVRAQAAELRRATEGGGTRELSGREVTLQLDERSRIQSAQIIGDAHLRDSRPAQPKQAARSAHLAANQMKMWFKDEQLDHVQALDHVRLESSNANGRTEGVAAELDLTFSGREQELSQVEWKGGVRIVTTPLNPSADTRVISSDDIQVFLQPGGRELSSARTLAPGRIELLPGRPRPGEARSTPSRRVLTAERLSMEFDADGEARALRGEKNVRLESTPVAAAGVSAPSPRISTSDFVLVAFARDSQLQTVEQTGAVRYTDAEQQASAEKAVYTAADERIQLTGKPSHNPEVLDAETRTSAESITLDQKNRTGTAEGHVRTVYTPRGTNTAGAPAGARRAAGQPVPGLLSTKDPIYVVADRMVANKNGITRYEGTPARRARLWQNGDVIEARTLILERDQKRLRAEGGTTTVLVEHPTKSPATPQKSAGATKPGSEDERPIAISAERMVYTDTDRKAHYEGGVVLRRQQSTVRCASLDAFFFSADEVKEGDSRLLRALARGGVEITETLASGTRRAAAELAEYTTVDEKVVLSGGDPYVFEEQRGYTRGRQLTYYVANDSIFVHGDSATRTVTEQHIRRR